MGGAAFAQTPKGRSASQKIVWSSSPNVRALLCLLALGVIITMSPPKPPHRSNLLRSYWGYGTIRGACKSAGSDAEARQETDYGPSGDSSLHR